LVERGTQPLKGYWSLPGGALEPGETLVEGVRREVLEETGLVVRPVEQAKIFERIMRDREGRPEYHYVLVDFVCKPISGELAPASDANRAEWVRLKDLRKYPITEGTLEVIEEVYEKRKRRPARV
jgi:ADP-ribose pyrophosphatase YjhB (NUDIX family)